jgi:hypothetical protein
LAGLILVPKLHLGTRLRAHSIVRGEGVRGAWSERR